MHLNVVGLLKGKSSFEKFITNGREETTIHMKISNMAYHRLLVGGLKTKHTNNHHNRYLSQPTLRRDDKRK